MASLYSIPKALQLTILQFLMLKTVIAISQPNYFFTTCDIDNYTQNSVYQKNLNQLLLELTTQTSKTSFYNLTIGETLDKIYGTYYCRADIDPQLCHDCVQAAAQAIVTNCTSKEAVIWYQECTLRYSNRPIFGIDEDDLRYAWWFSDGNVSNPDDLQQVLSTTIDSLILKAAYIPSYHGFATGEDPFPPFPTLYTLVQCSPDILGLPCERCLRRIFRDMQVCCNGGRLWVMMFRTNCQMRYDMVPFYTPPPPPSSPSTPTGS